MTGRFRGRKNDVAPLLVRPPAIVFALVGDTFEFDGRFVSVSATPSGFYEPSSNVIVLVLPWRIDDTSDRSVLLHELVHVARLSSSRWRCLDETEWEAYQLQRRWLAERGMQLQLDWILIGILSRCPEDSS